MPESAGGDPGSLGAVVVGAVVGVPDGVGVAVVGCGERVAVRVGVGDGDVVLVGVDRSREWTDGAVVAEWRCFAGLTCCCAAGASW